ncbi:putative MFS-type transporter [Mycobacterium attenuatum]|nr:putative MFS-type transporter [Mycobacterium attenuatum]
MKHHMMPAETKSATQRWAMLGVSIVATLTATVFVKGVAFLIPVLDENRGISLAGAALLSAMPGFGMLFTHIVWGYLLDRLGERIVLTAGLALTAAAAYAAASMPPTMLPKGTCFFAGGMAAASAFTASGRLVTGWFPTHQRGVAMGIRQTAGPLGTAVAAVLLPELGKHSLSSALLFPAVICGSSALLCAVVVRDPAWPQVSVTHERESANPYRGSLVLWRIHLASALLMVPQTVAFTFMLVWLIEARSWSVQAAGVLVGVTQFLGALGRIVVGRWSDRAGSRMRPVRHVATGAAVVMLLLAVTDHLHSPVAIMLMVAASVITVLDNGLAVTAIAEFAGRFWTGRAMGAQNTTQTISASIAAPAFGEVIEMAGYPVAFAVGGLLPLLALPIVPVSARPHALEAITVSSADHDGHGRGEH